MGLYLLNISVDAVDANPDFIAEDLSYNEQESIIEFIAESILGHKDAFPEYDDHDPEEHGKKSNLKIDFLLPHQVAIIYDHLPIPESKEKFPDYITRLPHGFGKEDFPPPKV